MNGYDLLSARELHALYWRARRMVYGTAAPGERGEMFALYRKLAKALRARHGWKLSPYSGGLNARFLERAAGSRLCGHLEGARISVDEARDYRQHYPRPLP